MTLKTTTPLVCALALLSCRGSTSSGNVRLERGEAAPDAGVAAVEPPSPTYWNRVAGILERHCVSCHAEGGIGPMPLASFEDAKGHAGAMAWQTRERHMPPWLPSTAACAPLQHARSLPEVDIRALERWAELGAPEGSKSDARPLAPKRRDATVPDRVAVPDEGYAPKAGRSDDYHCFVLDPKLERPERITALRIVPGLATVVHHVLLFEVRKSAIERIKELDRKEPGPGYTCFGGIGVTPSLRAGDLSRGELVDFDAQMIVGWAPGAGATDVAGAPTPLPSGTAIKLAAGSRLVMQVHYSLEGHQPPRGVPNRPGALPLDRTRVDLWLAKDDESLRQAVWIPLLKYDFKVPANAGPEDPRASASAEIPLPFSLEVRGVAPHMHLRGKSIRVDAVNEDGASCLLDVPRWDFHHQEGYWLEKGVRVSRASVSCIWDNRANAQPIVSGKRKISRDLRWGEGTDDEMCLAFLYATL